MALALALFNVKHVLDLNPYGVVAFGLKYTRVFL